MTLAAGITGIQFPLGGTHGDCLVSGSPSLWSSIPRYAWSPPHLADAVREGKHVSLLFLITSLREWLTL